MHIMKAMKRKRKDDQMIIKRKAKKYVKIRKILKYTLK